MRGCLRRHSCGCRQDAVACLAVPRCTAARRGAPKMLSRVYVNSAAIEWIAYDPTTRRMQIKFRDGTQVYDFCRMPQSIYEAFIAARSHGQFYNDHIKDRYDCF